MLKADREGLLKHFSLKNIEFSQEIKETGTTIIDDPDYIFNFINEVSLGINYPNDDNPTNNWLFDFNNFADIISALKHTFKIKESLEEKRIKRLLIRELETNLIKFMILNPDLEDKQNDTNKTINILDYFKEKYNNRILDKENKPLFIENPFCITGKEFSYFYIYSCMIPITRGFRDIKTSILDRVIDEGFFLNFDIGKSEYDNSLLSLSLEILSDWLHHFRNIFTTDVYKKFTNEMLKITFVKEYQSHIELSVTAAGIIMAFVENYRIPHLISAILDILKNDDFQKLIEFDFKK